VLISILLFMSRLLLGVINVSESFIHFKRGRKVIKRLMSGNISEEINSEVRVVSFDLDNTLWKTSEVINFANDALFDYLSTSGISQSKRVEVVMGKLFKENKHRYCPEDVSESPVLLTQLRTDAITDICIRENGYNDTYASTFAKSAFEVWSKARHEAIPNNFAEHVIPCIHRIREIRTSSGDPVIIGAITDGNSNPFQVEVLSELFDFCINAENVGIAKPGKEVYLEAVKKVSLNPYLKNLYLSKQKYLEDAIGPWWIHIGDNFMKDIVPAKQLNMRTVWSRELISKPSPRDTKKYTDQDLTSFMNKVSKEKTLDMYIGSDDFLIDSLQNDFADAVIDQFQDLMHLLHSWHNNALSSQSSLPKQQISNDQDHNFNDACINRDSEGLKNNKVDNEANAEIEASDSLPIKFCIFCGTEVPIAAKFCFSCGKRTMV